MSELLTEKTKSIVILDTPVQRGATSIREVVLRKPQSGALRGLRLQAVMEMDVASMMTIIPRISSPELTPQEMAELDPADLASMSLEVVLFLLPKSATSAFQPA
ncbi:phage tail assembly protein [Klebsiella pneumoniae]|uniref:phage tail assembly protein n=1 Tax=Klebsiella pneumoniae TaxID=573 RepID=UPI000E2C8836|nr:phage tail assembly protein [Klebsiella pneumoniae]EIW8468525.1 phage tail assembly protein [Klebsiella pneumoniae]EIW8500458.1 phage tail assembly protein [Klebsiella pneumoniae]SYC52416.1 phage tail protein E [Klebsiella pneumoniae]HBS7674597.1 phage tail assembly protein [Klebsiella pneumoniae]HCB4002341.1 phage tail assembly protein [Klebsiella pneumoniae]